MFNDLQWICVGFFTLSVPLLVLARYRYPEIRPGWIVLSSIILGWCLANAAVGLQHLEVESERRQDRLAIEEEIRHPRPPIMLPDGSAYRENTPLYEYLWRRYQPLGALLYGLAYSTACLLAAWLLVRPTRKAIQSRPTLVSVGVLLIVWVAAVGYDIKPPSPFADADGIYRWNHFFGPQLSLPVAATVGWIVSVAIPELLVSVRKSASKVSK